MKIVYVICTILCDVILTSATTECFDCNNVTTVAECTNTKTCDIGEICYTNFLPQVNGGTLYSFGCRPETNCTSVVSNTKNATDGGTGILIGRSLQTSSCSQCCKEYHCNRHLCQQTFHGQVHGNWSMWSSWGSCSTTCGIGMQRRDRTCSKPYPARFGDHCFGDSRDDRLCVAAVCPVTDGGWGTWTSWTACSASCGGGMKSHYRDCNNPIPSAGGKPCNGTPYEVVQCNQQSCPRKLSSFYYSNPVSVGHEYRYQEFKGSIMCKARTDQSIFEIHLAGCYTLAFNTSIFQEGAYYSSKTGLFTCHYPGFYVFTASLVSSYRINCLITKNDNAMTILSAEIPVAGNDAYTSATATLYLRRDDKVSLFCQHPSNHLHSSSTFGGFLVQADN